MGTIATVGQQDDTSCGFYSGYAVHLVNQAGRFSPGLAMSNEEVEAKRKSFYGGRSATLSEMDAARYLNEGLGVITEYKCSYPYMIQDVQAKVKAALEKGKAMMWGDVTHWYALLGIVGGDTCILYDPAGQRGIINTVALAFVDRAVFMVHPRW